MTQSIRKVFLDTSVVFAAVLSLSGGSRKLFQLGEASLLRLFVGHTVLRECDEVIRRKAPTSLPVLARLLEVGRVEIAPAPTAKQIEFARSILAYKPDVYVLAEAIRAEPDWFVTHDSVHFLKEPKVSNLEFKIGTPGDLIQSLIEDFKF